MAMVTLRDGRELDDQSPTFRAEMQKVLDARAEAHKAKQASKLAQTWDDAVDVLQRYVHFASPEQAWGVVLWAAATHRAMDFPLLPRLAVRAPTKQSGKTRLLEVLSELVASKWGPIIGPSAAAVYRKIEVTHPTILLDEVDRLFEKRAEDNAAILEVLNAGHVNGATVPRVMGIGTKQTVHDFPVYTPVALAGIAANWPDTIMDRSVVVTLERRKATEAIERYRMADHAIPAAVGARIAEHMEPVTFGTVQLPGHLSDRAQDNWEPLFQVAQAAGAHWPDRARDAASVLGAAAAELLEADERDEVQLLKDVVLIFDREQPISGFIGSTELVKHLTELDSRPWSDWPHGFTTHKLAKLLRRLGIKPENPFGSSKRGYGRKAIHAVWDRLGTRTVAPTASEEPDPSGE